MGDHTAVPTIGQLRRAAYDLLTAITKDKKNKVTSRGGFQASKEGKVLKLEFIIEDSMGDTLND